MIVASAQHVKACHWQAPKKPFRLFATIAWLVILFSRYRGKHKLFLAQCLGSKRKRAEKVSAL